MKQIYLDNAATTKPLPGVVDAMKDYLYENYGNPSSLYDIGQINKQAIENARQKVARLLGVSSEEILFTSGGSESDNWALKGILMPGDHIITTKIEHHAILNACKWLEDQGVEVTYLDVNKYGFVNPEDVGNAIKDNTFLVSIMYANNEIGAIQPIKQIGEIVKKNNIIFHVDAVQAFGHVPIDVDECCIDLLSCSSHKIYGPKGVGALFVRDTVKIDPLIHGGGQEFGIRGGTENVFGIVGFGAAAEIAYWNMGINAEKEKLITTLLLQRIQDRIPHIKLNGPSLETNRLPNNLNISVDGIRGEELMMLLNVRNIYVSTGSACNSSNGNPSHVLKAIGLSDEEANSSIRITVSPDIDENDIAYIVDSMAECVERLRSKSNE